MIFSFFFQPGRSTGVYSRPDLRHQDPFLLQHQLRPPALFVVIIKVITTSLIRRQKETVMKTLTT